MNGNVESYRLNDPMSWKEFKKMPDDLKVTYIKLLREKYNPFDSAIADVIGINKVTFSQEIKRLGLGHGKKHGGRRAWPEREAFYAWAAGVPANVTPEEVEEQVTKPLEQSMATLNNIKTLQSSSSANYCTIAVYIIDEILHKDGGVTFFF